MSRIRNTARACRDAFVGLLHAPRRYRPSFPPDAELFAALRSDLPVGSRIRSAARSGAITKARELLAAHFRERRTPRFFVDPEEIRSLADRFAREHPDWRDHANGVATDWRRYVYPHGHRAQASQGGLPDWNDLPLGPGADTVQLHRAHHFAFATQLARAQAYGAPTTAMLEALVDTWIAATAGNPDSPAYLSPLIAVHRAFAISWTLPLLAGATERSVALEVALLGILLADARFVRSKLGTSAANNHLLGDAFLLFYLGILYPEFEEAGSWRREGEALFLRELDRQVYADGTSFEHSVHYHEFVCEMLTAIVLIARRNGIPLEPWVLERHRRMLEFQAALSGPEARATPIGDTVEHQLLAIDSFDGVGGASHRELLRALYAPDFAVSTPDAPGRERAAWLLAGELVPAGTAQRDACPVEFPDGGFVVMPDPVFDGSLILRTGPSPGLSCQPGHMHSDLLSVYVRVRGTPVIVEAGTYTYRSERERWAADEPPWRAYFLGPSAHNGLCIATYDPLGRTPGDFPWGELRSRVVARRTTSAAGLTWVEASVMGETPYSGHTRGVVHVEGSYWLVYDLLPPSASVQDAWLSLQFSPETVLRRQSDHSALALTGNARLQITSNRDSLPLLLFTAERVPPAGWVSPCYGRLDPAPALRIPTKGGPLVAVTLLDLIADVDRPPVVDLEASGSGAIGVRISRGETVDYVIVPRGALDREASFFGINFRGAAIWLRAERGHANESRVLEGREARSNSLGL